MKRNSSTGLVKLFVRCVIPVQKRMQRIPLRMLEERERFAASRKRSVLVLQATETIGKGPTYFRSEFKFFLQDSFAEVVLLVEDIKVPLVRKENQREPSKITSIKDIEKISLHIYLIYKFVEASVISFSFALVSKDTK